MRSNLLFAHHQLYINEKLTGPLDKALCGSLVYSCGTNPSCWRVSFPSKAPCKRTQHCCMYMLRPFAHPVACCCGKFETGQTFELPTFLLDSFAQLFKHCWGQARNKLAVELKGRFPFNKSSGLKFRKIHAPNGRYIPVAQSRPKPMLVWLLLL